MKVKIFVIFDDKAKAYLQPFFLTEVGQAIRAVSDCVADPNHNFGRHPHDYTLFVAGEFDDREGRFDIRSAPEVIAHLWELVPKTKTDQPDLFNQESRQ